MVDDPRPGYFLVRLVKGGPRIPARILRDFGQFYAEIDGKRVGPADEDPIRAEGVLRIWHFGQEISEREYHQALGTRAEQPLDPGKPVDLGAARSVF